MGPESCGFNPEDFRMHAKEEKESDEIPSVPDNEMQFTFSSSGGPGGQNANKVASKATLRWNVGGSAAFSEEQKQAIRDHAGKYRSEKTDDVVIQANEHRDQPQNRKAAADRLQNMVEAALTPQKERKETKVSYNQKQKRVDEKKREGRKKEDRRFKGDE